MWSRYSEYMWIPSATPMERMKTGSEMVMMFNGVWENAMIPRVTTRERRTTVRGMATPLIPLKVIQRQAMTMRVTAANMIRLSVFMALPRAAVTEGKPAM